MLELLEAHGDGWQGMPSQATLNSLVEVFSAHGEPGKESSEPAHAEAITGISNLADLFERMGRPDQAEPLYAWALRERTALLGRGHPDTLKSMFDLAGLLHAQGRVYEARVLHEQALETRMKQLQDVLHGKSEASAEERVSI